MPIIDEKGRIFGFINIIDFFVILFLITTITGFLHLAYTGNLYKDFDPQKKEHIKKVINLNIQKQTFSDISEFKKQLNLEESNNVSRSQNINITSFELSTQTCVETTPEDRYDLQITATIDAYLDRTSSTYYYENQQLIIGVPFYLEMGGKNYTTQILNIT